MAAFKLQLRHAIPSIISVYHSRETFFRNTLSPFVPRQALEATVLVHINPSVSFAFEAACLTPIIAFWTLLTPISLSFLSRPTTTTTTLNSAGALDNTSRHIMHKSSIKKGWRLSTYYNTIE
eukprot:scaffold4380_cov146-Skeletonema_menzelii.AAC.6